MMTSAVRSKTSEKTFPANGCLPPTAAEQGCDCATCERVGCDHDRRWSSRRTHLLKLHKSDVRRDCARTHLSGETVQATDEIEVDRLWDDTNRCRLLAWECADHELEECRRGGGLHLQP